MAGGRPTILLVDDDEVAVMAFERAVAAQSITARVEIARDGDDALSLLREPGRIPSPFVMVLDLNMPRMNGIEVLGEVRADPALRDTVIFILTTSDAPQDILACYRHNIAGYIVKEDAYGTIGDTVALIAQFTDLVTLPAQDFR